VHPEPSSASSERASKEARSSGRIAQSLNQIPTTRASFRTISVLLFKMEDGLSAFVTTNVKASTPRATGTRYPTPFAREACQVKYGSDPAQA
jgi:hypothetical protein